MLTADLLKELLKRGEENIEFIEFDKDGNRLNTFVPFVCDSVFIYKQRDIYGNFTNTCCIGFLNAKTI